MDLCRGSLLAQIWSDTPWLSPPEREQMAEFIALLKAQPRCFGNSRFILGDPRKDEAYGYCCTDGKRAFLAIHNCCWKDSLPRLELNSAWGLPDGQAWDLYRWYPDPARAEQRRGDVRPRDHPLPAPLRSGADRGRPLGTISHAESPIRRETNPRQIRRGQPIAGDHR